jgi:hypothetical protein
MVRPIEEVSMLKNQYGRYMQSHELLPLLGFIPGHHLPPEGMAPISVQGVMFMCTPADGLYDTFQGKKVKSSKHRIHYLCEACDKWIPFGRAGQHNKGKEHKLNYEIMVGRP